ncbi:hypothetical protein Tco_1464765 [Tanacetum coccineum]
MPVRKVTKSHEGNATNKDDQRFKMDVCISRKLFKDRKSLRGNIIKVHYIMSKDIKRLKNQRLEAPDIEAYNLEAVSSSHELSTIVDNAPRIQPLE